MAAETAQSRPVRRRHRPACGDVRPDQKEPAITVPELTQLGPGVFALPTSHSWAYLWRHAGGVTLVDTGQTGDHATVLDAIHHLGYDNDDLVRIVLTHWHHDHMGAAAELARLTRAQMCAGRADAPVVRGHQPGTPPDLTPAEVPLMERIAGLVPPAAACPVDRELTDGDVLDGGEDTAVILTVPGHTPGSIAVHLPGERVVLTGDIAARFDEQVTLGPFNTDREQARESLRRLAGLDVDAAGFGHGTPVTHGAAEALASWTDPLA